MIPLKNFIDKNVDQDRLYLSMWAVTAIILIKFFLIGSYPHIYEVYSAGSIMEHISTNLQSSPLTDIKVISAGDSCPSGYIFTPIGEYYGTADACWDRISKKYSDIESSCSWPEYLLLRKTVDRTHSAYFHNWFGSNFCVLQNSNFYYTLSECQEGYAKCGATLCVPENENCPLSDIKFVKADNGTVSLALKSDFRSNSHFYKLDFSLNELPCMSRFLMPRVDSLPLPLLQNPRGCNVVDKDSIALTNATGAAFFSQYNDTVNEMSRLPLVKDVLFNESVLLVARRHLLMTLDSKIYKDCLDLATEDDIDVNYYRMIEDEQGSESFFNGLTWVVIILQGLVIAYSAHIGGVKEFIGPLAIFAGLILLELIAIEIHSWTVSDVIHKLHHTSKQFVKAGTLGCFQNDDLNTYLRNDFANVWALFAARVPAINGFFWIIFFILIAFSGVSAFWVIQNKNRESIQQIDELIRDSEVWNRDHLKEMQEVRAKSANPKNEEW